MTSGLYGNWGAINVHLRNLQRANYKDKVLKPIGELIAQRVRQNIMQQRLAFEPLVEEYLSRKIAQGYDSRILAKTETFVDAIEVKDIQSSGNSFNVIVGVKDGSEQESGISLEELSYYIEYGTDRQPARYPFTLSWEEMRGRVTNETIDLIKVTLQEAIR
ncbi:hypothetical protein D1872_130080 [compost metagenome]